MSIKRILSGIILFPIFAIILIFGNKYVVDVFISIVALMSLHEFYKAFTGKANPIRWPGYITAVLICFIHLIPGEYVLPSITLIILMNMIKKLSYALRKLKLINVILKKFKMFSKILLIFII